MELVLDLLGAAAEWLNNRFRGDRPLLAKRPPRP
jgi:hypothetical protein